MSSNGWLEPDWPAPGNVSAIVTTRLGGHSRTPYKGMNLATHVGDDAEVVQQNRRVLAECAGISLGNFCWLKQVHGNLIVSARPDLDPVQADGSDTNQVNLACVVLTADCLPVLLCSLDGAQVSAVHAGWCGLAGGVLQQAVQRYPEPKQVIAWLGPAIGPAFFEVGAEVYQAFVSQNDVAKHAFVKSKQAEKWQGNLYQLATHQLQMAGVTQVFGGNFCTYSDSERFYSYRRDGEKTGRMATLIWRKA